MLPVNHQKKMKPDKKFEFEASATNAVDNQENQMAERLAFSRRLKRAMDAKDLMQVDLARALGVGRDIISKYCAGKNFPSRRNLRKLAEVLELSPGDLAAHHIIAATDTFMPPGVTPLEPSLEIKILPDGRALLRMQQVLPMRRITKIVELLGESEGRERGQRGRHETEA